ncbi:MAG: ParA family protein [Alteromonadaceae bacterium]|nr:ParA family protein [Alteromonadaceae bacterium]
MKTIAFFNTKGGVGKTTITSEAAIFASENLSGRVLVIDTDINASLLDYAYDREHKHDMPFPEVTGHVQTNIDRLIKSLRNSGKYDYIIIDCHGDFDQLDKNLMYEADLVVLPVMMDEKSVRPTIKVIQEKILPIIDERAGELDYVILINNIKKNHGKLERNLISLIEQTGLNLCPKKILKHDAKFRDVWHAGVTMMEVYNNKMDASYENAGINLKLVLADIFKRVS